MAGTGPGADPGQGTRAGQECGPLRRRDSRRPFHADRRCGSVGARGAESRRSRRHALRAAAGAADHPVSQLVGGWWLVGRIWLVVGGSWLVGNRKRSVGRVLLSGPGTAFFLLLLSGCVRQVPVVTPSGPIIFAVVTWNTHGDRGDLPRLLDDLASGRLTGATVRDYVVLLQEAPDGGDRDVAAIAAERGLPAYFSVVRRGPVRSTGNAILSTRPLMDARAIDLPRERQPRAAAIATMQLGGETLFVISTHLENRLGWLRGLFGDRARGRQADALLREIPPQQQGILGGDMNTMLGPTEPAWQALLKRFPDTPPRPEPTFRDRLVLDHLFLDLPAGWAATRRVVEARYGSDHHPVVGVIHESQ